MEKPSRPWTNRLTGDGCAYLHLRNPLRLARSLEFGDEHRYETFVSCEWRQVVGERERDPPPPAKHVSDLDYWNSCRDAVAVLENESKRPVTVTVG
jgi:hypothetical protein